MLSCSVVAMTGAIVTYFLTPTYDAKMLVQEGKYLPLDHAFLRPSDADMLLLEDEGATSEYTSGSGATVSSTAATTKGGSKTNYRPGKLKFPHETANYQHHQHHQYKDKFGGESDIEMRHEYRGSCEFPLLHEGEP